MGRQVYLQWSHFQRRPLALRAAVPFDLHFVDSPVVSSRLRIVDYLIKAVRTWSLLRRRPAEVLWVATPPVFLIYLAFLYRALSGRRFLIVIDCHNGAFLEPWGSFPGLRSLLKAADLCVVHTPYARVFLERHGVGADHIAVLEDLPPQVDLAQGPVTKAWRRFAGPYVVIATSFRADQPVELFVELARRLPGVTVVVTGDHARRCRPSRLADAPENLVLTGFLETAVFDTLLGGAEALIGLTLRENAIVSVAAEGLGFNVPLVLSDTPALRAHVPKGAVFVDTASAAAVAEGVALAMATGDALRRALAELRGDRIADGHRQAERLLARLRLAAQPLAAAPLTAPTPAGLPHAEASAGLPAAQDA